MSENHASPRPTPQPFCSVYARYLPMLHMGLLSAEEQADVEAHLAECEWCQNQLATYDVLDAALRRQFAGESTASVASPVAGSRTRARPLLSLEDIMKADQQQTPTATRGPSTPPSPFGLARNRKVTALGAIAAVLVLTVLAASLFAYFGSRGVAPGVKPTPTRGLDAQSQAYLNVLETYYQPEAGAFIRVQRCRMDATTDSDGMRTCQSLAPPVVTDAQALKDHLTVTPPVRWQADDIQIKQATDDTITGWSAVAAATTVDEWKTAQSSAESAFFSGYCLSIRHINADLLPAGLPLSSLLSNPDPTGSC